MSPNLRHQQLSRSLPLEAAMEAEYRDLAGEVSCNETCQLALASSHFRGLLPLIPSPYSNSPLADTHDKSTGKVVGSSALFTEAWALRKACGVAVDQEITRAVLLGILFIFQYSKDNPIASQKNFEGVKKIISAPSIPSLQPKPFEFQSKQRDSNRSSYANILKGGSSGRLKLVKAKEVGLRWLQKSAVGNSIWDAQIHHMGNVLISFDYLESLNEFLKDETKVLSKWSSSVQAWDDQKIPPSRCVWIFCYGVPLNAWCSSTFIEIGKVWGDVIKLDELTEKFIAFNKGRLFIITDYLDCINEVVHIKINGMIFPVKVIEDPMAETSWEKRVFTSIKIKKGNDKEEKRP
ncbi:hypothetical protein RHSIM_Rhsim11G0150800 [Rhododendron simsii]|uniref:DUF4283 domain-containing protein n=1 Tax=Rhododendron simsii TaxID=118357 RepID=A0A834GAS9_RHOSS|nr:hypothetical protein RHSIM_Rhsim11G0150800 [Rhododendron simsii]